MTIQCLYLGDNRWKMMTSGGKEFKARNRSGRQPIEGRTYTVQLSQEVTHDRGLTTRRWLVSYFA